MKKTVLIFFLLVIACSQLIICMQEDDHRKSLQAFFSSMEKNDLENIEILLKKNFPLNEPILIIGSIVLSPPLSIVLDKYHKDPTSTFYPKLIALLINHGAKRVVECYHCPALSPLHHAASNGNINGVKCILKSAIQSNWPIIKPILVGYLKEPDCILQILPYELLVMILSYCSKQAESIKDITFLLTFNASRLTSDNYTPLYTWQTNNALRFGSICSLTHVLTTEERKELEQILDPHHVAKTYAQLKHELTTSKSNNTSLIGFK